MRRSRRRTASPGLRLKAGDTMPNSQEYYEQHTAALRDELASGNIITIAGAGVSVAATRGSPLAGWVGLLKHGIEHCVANVSGTDERWGRRQREALDEGTVEELISVARHVESKLGGTTDGRFYRWLRDTVGSLDAQVVDDRLPLALVKLPSLLLTTNYDLILETVSQKPSVSWANIHQVEAFLRREEDGIFHLHGSWREPSQVVLGVNYSSLLGDVQRQSILRSTLLQNRFLFVGVGAGINDPHFHALMEWSRKIYGQSAYSHYFLTRQQDLAEIETSVDEHIIVLPFGGEFEDLPGFIESLIPSTIMSTSSMPPSLNEYQIVIEGDVPKIEEIDFTELQDTLRALTNDGTLQLLRVEPGSLRLFISSSEEAKETLNALSKKGILRDRLLDAMVFKEAPGESSLVEQIAEGFRRPSAGLLNWPKTLSSGEWIERPEVARILEEVETNTSSATILLGGPGTGKSAFLSQLAGQAIERGLKVVACKADLLPADVTSGAQLQELWGLPLSVEDSVRHLCRSGKTLLLIDQLDALADILDVTSHRLNVLLELINGLAGQPNLHIIASSRTFEFAHDVRLSTIDASEMLLQPPRWQQVVEVLAQHGVDAKEWPETFREILRIPQHLKVMLANFCEANEPEPFASYQQMLEALWQKSVLPWPRRSELVDKIAVHMAETETLWVPRARYDSEYLEEISDLIAVDVLKPDEAAPRVGFSHQTLFSFARARTFAKGGQELSEYVVSGQSSLFIRPTLWSALFYIRAADVAEYERQFAKLWHHPELRQHVRFLLVDFLGQVLEPTNCEVEAVVDHLKQRVLVARILTSLAGNEDWFGALSGIIPNLMQIPHGESWSVTTFLRAALPFASERVLQLLRSHWFPQAERDAAVWRVLESPQEEWQEESQRMILEVLGRTDVASFHVTHLVKEVASSSPESALRIARCQLDKDLKRAQQGVPIPFEPSAEAVTEVDHLVERSLHRELKPLEELLERSGDWHELPDLAKRHPEVFLRELWPWFVRLVGLIVREERPHFVQYPGSWSLATELRHDEDGAAVHVVPFAHDVAVQECAKSNVSSFLAFVEDNRREHVLLVQRILARGLCKIVSTHTDACLDFLLSDERRLVLGDSQNIHKDSTALIRAVVPHLGPKEIEELEKYILSFNQHRDREDDDAAARRDKRRYNREHRLRLLNAIPEQCVSPETSAIIAAERTALIGYREWDTFSSGVVCIGSPMSTEQMTMAKNEDILGLFRELRDNTRWDHPRHSMQGGTIQASRAFAEFAKAEPERAIAIANSLVPGEHEIPVGQAVVALAESGLAPSRLYGLLGELWERGFQSETYREDAARAVRTTMNEQKQLPDDVCGLLEEWLKTPWRRPIDVADNKPSSEEESADLGAVLWATGGFELIPHGTYHALDALTYEYLRRKPPLTEEWMELLEHHLERQDRAEVWRTLTHWFDNLKFCDQPRATAFLARLFELYPGVLCSRNGAMLLAHARHWLHNESIQPWLETLRDAEWHLGPQAFGELEFLRRGNLSVSGEPFYIEFTDDSSASMKTRGIQKGLAHAAAYLWAELEYRSAATDVMLSLLPSDDGKILSAILDVFRVTNQLPADQETVRLLDGMCTHRVFRHEGRSTFFLDRLVDLVRHERGLVARVVECFIEEVTTQLAGFSTAFAGAAPQLADIALTLQRYEDTSEDGLRIFERLLELNAYGAQDVLNELDQIPKNISVHRSRRRSRHGPRRKRSFE